MKHLLKITTALFLAVLLAFTSVAPTFAAEITKPIKSFRIVETDDCRNSKYVESSSTLYIDQSADKVINYADLQLVTDPEDTDDTIYASPSDYEGGKHINYTYNKETNTYTFTATNQAISESYIDFSAESGASSKRITVKKCIPLTQYWISYNGTQQVQGGAANIPTINAFTKDNVVINATNRNSGANDIVRFSMWTDKNCTTPATDITLDADDYSCTVTNPSTGTFYLKAEAASRENSGLDRNLSCVLRITYKEFKSITDISFSQDNYDMGTVVDNQLDLSNLISYQPDQPDESIIYSSDNPSVAKVDTNTGKVTAVAGGTANITAQGSESGKSAVCRITVTPQISKLELQAEKNTLPLGSKMQINCIKTPADAVGTISWSSSNPDAISVDENGFITVNNSYSITEATNRITITAKSDSNVSISIDINIEEPVRTTAIDITPTKISNAALKTIDENANSYSIYKNDSITLNCTTATAGNAPSNDTIVWKVSINGAPEIPVNEATNYIADCRLTGNNLSFKSLTEDTLIFTAYAILLGQETSECSASDTIVIFSNTKSTGVTLSSGNTVIPTNSNLDIKVNSITPNVVTNKDEVVFVSSNTDIAEVSYNAANKTATITSKGNTGQAIISCYVCYDTSNYTDRALVKNITITVSSDIADSDITGINNVAYKGSAFGINDFPELAVSYRGLALVNGVDYTVAFSKDSAIGYASATFTGKGSYSGTKTVYYQIVQKDISSSAQISAISNQTYAAKELTPSFSVKVDNKTLKLNEDYTVSYYNNYNAGTATVVINGIGNYCGTAYSSFTITAAKTMTIANIAAQAYTGNAVCPAPAVTFGKTPLYAGIDYDVSYENNVNAGKATVIVTGKNNFTGTFKKEFTISQADITGNTAINVASSVKYTGKAVTPAVTVSCAGKTLTDNIDYIVAYKNNINIGTATVTITGKGNYKGTASTTFQIIPVPKGAKMVDGYWVKSKLSKASLTKITAGKKSFKASWKKVKGITGYQIQYSTDKKFKKNSKYVSVNKQTTASKQVKKLKSKKTYYVRIRTYKTETIGGQKVNVYSSWSKVKNVKVK